MADKNTANIGFEKQIWDAACVLWGHIPAAEYRNVIIGLIFLICTAARTALPISRSAERLWLFKA